MGERRTRFPSTSEVVYKVPSDMSMLAYFILWRGDAVVKGIKRDEETRANCTRLIQIFSHRYLSYVTPRPPFRYFSHTHVPAAKRKLRRLSNLSKFYQTLRVYAMTASG